MWYRHLYKIAGSGFVSLFSTALISGPAGSEPAMEIATPVGGVVRRYSFRT
jgi:hypothetical protein